MIDFAKLREPFPPGDIEWRLQECGKKGDKVWAMCLAYITNRAIMQRLDDVVGPDNWKNQYAPGPQGGVVCGLSIRCGDEWVTKWDGADNTQVEATKGGLSDAMKRAGVQWGIGRYLYNLESGFAIITENGEYRGKTKDNTYFKWNPPKLPAWALPPNAPAAPKRESPPLPEESAPETPKSGAGGEKPQQRQSAPPKTISDAQRMKLFAEMAEGIPSDERKAWMEDLGGRIKSHFKVESSSDLPAAKFNDVLKWVAEQKSKRPGGATLCSECRQPNGTHAPSCPLAQPE